MGMLQLSSQTAVLKALRLFKHATGCGRAFQYTLTRGESISNNPVKCRPAWRSWNDGVTVLYIKRKGYRNQTMYMFVKQRYASVLLCSNVHHPRSWTILFALACQSQLLNVLRAALCWTCSIWEILTLVCGSHIKGFFMPWHLCFNIAPHNVKCMVCIASYLVVVCIPGKGARDIIPR